MSAAIDYELLLAKYIEHVVAEEGTDFLMLRFRAQPCGALKGASDKVLFSVEEVDALNRLALTEWETP